MRRDLQFLQPARDLRCDRLVIFLMVLSPSFAEGDAVLDCVVDIWRVTKGKRMSLVRGARI